MKSIFIIISLQITIIAFSQAQTNAFSPGWYIIQEKAEYAVALPSYSDVKKDGNGKLKAPDIPSLVMQAGEVVLAFESTKGKVYCFDPLGRLIIFSDLSTLKKAPIVQGCGVGLLKEKIQLINGDLLEGGAYYWIIGQDLAKSTIKIMTTGGNKFDIPQDKIILLTALLKQSVSERAFKLVEN